MGLPGAIIGGALLGAGASIFGAKKQASAAEKAAEAQAQAADKAADLQWKMYTQSREDLAPWRDVGQGGLYSLADVMGVTVPGQTPTSKFGYLNQPFSYEDWKDPGYDFRFNEGVKALDRSAAARGDFFSGAHGKALTRYGQDYGANEYTNAYSRWKDYTDTLYNRYAGLAGTGQTTATNLANMGQNTGAKLGDIYLGAGNAQAQGYQNKATAMASGYAGLANAANAGIGNYLTWNYLQNNPSIYK